MSQVLSTQSVLPETAPALRAWSRLLRAHATTTRLLSASLLADHGLTLNDYEALYVLASSPDRRLKRVDLARRLVLTPSGVTRLLEGLEAAGYVERVACSTDLRVTYAALTESGVEKLEAASCAHVGAIEELMEAHFTTEELTQLADALDKLPGVADSDAACGG